MAVTIVEQTQAQMPLPLKRKSSASLKVFGPGPNVPAQPMLSKGFSSFSIDGDFLESMDSFAQELVSEATASCSNPKEAQEYDSTSESAFATDLNNMIMETNTAAPPLLALPAPVESYSIPAIPTMGKPGRRRLNITNLQTHRTDRHVRKDGVVEKEMVISTLRWFDLRVTVTDSLTGQALPDESISLEAQLLYENGLPVENLASKTPLLMGDTRMITCNGTARFRLKIKSLSSHRERQRFRIRVAPSDEMLNRMEPTLTAVTGPVKCITKLRTTKASSLASPGMVVEEFQDSSKKRSLDELASAFEDEVAKRSKQISQLEKTQQMILSQLQALSAAIQRN